jgi:hypothetical protein
MPPNKVSSKSGADHSVAVSVILLCAMTGSAIGSSRYVWYWGSPFFVEGTKQNHEYNYLTKNSGAHAVDMSEYTVGNDTKAWTSIVVQSLRPDTTPPTCSLQAYD